MAMATEDPANPSWRVWLLFILPYVILLGACHIGMWILPTLPVRPVLPVASRGSKRKMNKDSAVWRTRKRVCINSIDVTCWYVLEYPNAF